MSETRGISGRASNMLCAIREKKPLVHHITNFVTMNDCANAVLALGGLPVMAHDPAEMAEIVAAADSLVLNMGTPSAERFAVMEKAASLASERHIPTVFDPVGVGASRFRTEWAQKLVAQRTPSVIRGNSGEIAALLGVSHQVRGVDSINSAAQESVRDLTIAAARRWETCVVVSGSVDWISNGSEVVGVANGDAILRHITGAGCMLTSCIGTFVSMSMADAGTYSLMDAVTAAVAVYGVAAEWAASDGSSIDSVGKPPDDIRSKLWGPGIVRYRLYDALYSLDEVRLASAVRTVNVGGENR